jgi:hypothetical protein
MQRLRLAGNINSALRLQARSLKIAIRRKLFARPSSATGPALGFSEDATLRSCRKVSSSINADADQRWSSVLTLGQRPPRRAPVKRDGPFAQEKDMAENLLVPGGNSVPTRRQSTRSSQN